jgi:hypothetical protein
LASVLAQVVYGKASNPDAGDIFGKVISLSGDTLVVGTPGEASAARGVNGNQTDNSASAAGAVYVFVRSGTTWSQQAYLKASNTDAFDEFGLSVSLSGDTLAVGAPGESSASASNQASNAASQAGAVYVFVRTGTTWSQQAYLKASSIGAGDAFGSSVALSGDTLAVGATFEDSAATGINGNQNNNSAVTAGAAYVFQRTGTSWTQQAYLKASNTSSGDEFGASVALSGDTLAVGAPLEASAATGINGNQSDNSAGSSGAVYVFQRSGQTWTQQAYLKASNTNLATGNRIDGFFNDEFGNAVAVSGTTVVVGASQEAGGSAGINGNQADNTKRQAGAWSTSSSSRRKDWRGRYRTCAMTASWIALTAG